MKKKNTICFFSSYFEQSELPYYIRFYLDELSLHFSEIVFLTCNSALDDESIFYLKNKNIQILIVENKGWDFGMWYTAFNKYTFAEYDRVALVNDSCILFTSLNKFMQWVDLSNSDYIGITKSESVAPHIQSYFLILKKNVIKSVADYFKMHGKLNAIKDVISTYEIGLSTHLLKNGFSIDGYLKNSEYKGEFSPYYYFIAEQLKRGIPVIKKKIIFISHTKKELFTLARMNFRIEPDLYIRKIQQLYHSGELINFEKVKSDFKPGLSAIQIFNYNCKRTLIQLYKKIKNN